jgi:hypothetical protein
MRCQLHVDGLIQERCGVEIRTLLAAVGMVGSWTAWLDTKVLAVVLHALAARSLILAIKTRSLRRFFEAAVFLAAAYRILAESVLRTLGTVAVDELPSRVPWQTAYWEFARDWGTQISFGCFVLWLLALWRECKRRPLAGANVNSSRTVARDSATPSDRAVS